MKPHLLCPECESPVFYTGDVEITALGDTGKSWARGIYRCKNPGCQKFETQVKPQPR